jgi:hypothetical protein
VRAVDEGHGDDARKRLKELERKVDELVREGKISAAATGEVRQEVAQLGNAVGVLGLSPDRQQPFMDRI